MNRKLYVCAVFLVVFLTCFTLWHELGRYEYIGPTLRYAALGRDFGQLPKREEVNWPTREVYDKIRTFVMFIGYPRSGHSLVGSLIDAHPHAVVSHEVDIVNEWKNLDPPRRNKYALFDLLYHDSNLEAKSGIRSNSSRYSYTYCVPNQWQGKYNKHIQVIGDKKGGKTTRILTGKSTPRGFKDIQKAINLPIKFLHVVRNPFDNIATLLLRTLKLRLAVRDGEVDMVNNTKLLDKMIVKYFSLASMNNQLQQKFASKGMVLELHHNGFIERPRKTLTKVCRFLKLQCSKKYLDDCARIVFKSRTLTRKHVVWSEKQRKDVLQRMKNYPFLKEYTFEN